MSSNSATVPKNYAFVDGQNLYMGTSKSEPEWEIDLARFRVYLNDKYHVTKAFYYLGYVQEGDKIQKLYEDIQAAGFILVFRQHNSAMITHKKGNVDSDIIFNIMKRLYTKEAFDKIVLVSGDGDYKMLIDFLVEENKLEKILFPNQKRSSSLYKMTPVQFKASLDQIETKRTIGK